MACARDEIYLVCLIARPVVTPGSGHRAAPRAVLGRGDRSEIAIAHGVSLAIRL